MNTQFKIIVVFYLTVWLFPIVVLAGPVPDTGQIKCYNNTEEISCPHAGEAFYGQDANYIITPPSYTKLDASGNELPDNFTSWVMIRDNITGLLWEGKTDDGSIHDMDNKYIWRAAKDLLIYNLNSTDFGGHTDWRIPTVKELSMIRTYDVVVEPNFFNWVTFFPNFVPFWSSDSNINSPGQRWGVYGPEDYQGGSIVSNSESAANFVRAVRGDYNRPKDPFVSNNDGTVTDIGTGLMWQKVTIGPLDWETALSACESLVLSGYTDWRLPNINELRSIQNYSRNGQSIDIDYFPDSVYSFYWSSSPTTFGGNNAFAIDFSNGVEYVNNRSIAYYVLAVRGGQIQSGANLLIKAPEQGERWELASIQQIT